MSETKTCLGCGKWWLACTCNKEDAGANIKGGWFGIPDDWLDEEGRERPSNDDS